MKRLIRFCFVVFVFVVFWGPTPGPPHGILKNSVFACSFGDQSDCVNLQVLDIGNNWKAIYADNAPGPIMEWEDCSTFNCSERDPGGGGGTICYTPPVAPGCYKCGGGCSNWQQCSDNDCWSGRSGCDATFGGGNCQECERYLSSCSGQYCTDYCTGNSAVECLAGSNCSWNNLTGTCAGSVDAWGHCQDACGNCLVVAPPPVTNKTCTIDSVTPASPTSVGTTVTVAFSGNNDGLTNPSDTVSAYISRTDSGTLAGLGNPVNTDSSGHNYYQIGSCTSTGSTACSGSASLTTLTLGTYNVWCGLNSDPSKCSGNPFCSYENLGGTEACTGYISCSTSDNKSLTVVPPPVTLQSRAVVTGATADCSAVRASTNGINGAVHSFTVAPAPSPAPQTQSGASYVNFSSNPPGPNTAYTLSINNPSADYVLRQACWAQTNPVSSGTGQSVSLNGGETVTWDVGYSAGSAWSQTKEGSVYAAGTIKNFVPSLTSPRVFNLDSASLYPGVVTYGTDYDFAADTTSRGANFVSSKNWLVNQTNTAVDYYNLFYHRFGSPTTPDTFADLTNVTKPVSRPTPYYVIGDMTTSGDWTVGNGESIVLLVDGNLTIGGNINVTGTGFVAFVVKGNIVVSSSVGGPYTSGAPVVEGIYVTSPTGAIETGLSSVAGKERLVGRGMFVAGSFLLQRDLDSLGKNITTSAELFTYNPELLFTMPEYMKDVPVTWQEVAP